MDRFLLLGLVASVGFASPVPHGRYQPRAIDSSKATTLASYLAATPSALVSSSASSSVEDVHAAVAITPLEPSVVFSTGPAITFVNTAGAPVLTEDPKVIAHTTYIAITPSAEPDNTLAASNTPSTTPSVDLTAFPSVLSQASSVRGQTSNAVPTSAAPTSLATPTLGLSLAKISSDAAQSSVSTIAASIVVPTSAAVSAIAVPTSVVPGTPVVASSGALMRPVAVPTSARIVLGPASGISPQESPSAVVPTSIASSKVALTTSAVALASSDQIVPSSVMHSHGVGKAAPSTRGVAGLSSEAAQASFAGVRPLPSSVMQSTRRFTYNFPTSSGSLLYGSYRSPATSATPVAALVTSQAKAQSPTTTLTTIIEITVPVTSIVTLPTQATSEADVAPSPQLPAFTLPVEPTAVPTPVQWSAASSYQAAAPKFTLAGTTAVQSSEQAAPTPGTAELPAAYTNRPKLQTDSGNSSAISAAAGGIQIVPVNPSGVVFVTITETKTTTVDHTVTAFATVTQRVTMAAA